MKHQREMILIADLDHLGKYLVQPAVKPVVEHVGGLAFEVVETLD
jgi:hypothetical protein